MDNCSITISAYHNYAGIDWYLKKIDGEWQQELTCGHTWDDGGCWSAENDSIAESMIDDLIEIAKSKIDTAPELLNDGDTLADAERDGIVVDVIFNVED